MFKIWFYQLKYELCKISVFRIAVFIVYLAVFGSMMYIGGEENFDGFNFLYFWIPGSILAADYTIEGDAVRLLPMTDMQFRGFIIVKGIMVGIITSFCTAVSCIPAILRWGCTYITFLKILLAVLYVGFVFWSYKYRYEKRSYPNIKSFVLYVILMALCGGFTSDLSSHTIWENLAMAFSAVIFVLYFLIQYHRLRKIPVEEISFANDTSGRQR